MSESFPPELEGEQSTTIFVYRVIADADDRLTYEEIIEETNLSLRAVKDKTSVLVEKGLIESCWTVSQYRAFQMPEKENNRGYPAPKSQ